MRGIRIKGGRRKEKGGRGVLVALTPSPSPRNLCGGEAGLCLGRGEEELRLIDKVIKFERRLL